MCKRLEGRWRVRGERKVRERDGGRIDVDFLVGWGDVINAACVVDVGSCFVCVVSSTLLMK